MSALFCHDTVVATDRTVASGRVSERITWLSRQKRPLRAARRLSFRPSSLPATRPVTMAVRHEHPVCQRCSLSRGMRIENLARRRRDFISRFFASEGEGTLLQDLEWGQTGVAGALTSISIRIRGLARGAQCGCRKCALWMKLFAANNFIHRLDRRLAEDRHTRWSRDSALFDHSHEACSSLCRSRCKLLRNPRSTHDPNSAVGLSH